MSKVCSSKLDAFINELGIINIVSISAICPSEFVATRNAIKSLNPDVSGAFVVSNKNNCFP